jgi:hypothetical protein
VKRQFLGDARVRRFVETDGADAQRPQAGVPAGELRLERVSVEEIGENDLAKLPVLHAAWTTADAEDALDAGISECLAQRACPNHTAGTEEDDVHRAYIPNGILIYDRID